MVKKFNAQFIKELRFKRVKTCSECHMCNKNACDIVRKSLTSYGSGIRFTSDGFDCALPVAIDSHNVCSFNCLYCFSDNVVQHRDSTNKGVIKQLSLAMVKDLFSGKRERLEPYRIALRYHKRNKNGYPCPVQLGAINDPLDNIERQQGWFLEYVKIAGKYNQPSRISTKGKLFLLDEYIDALRPYAHLFWVAFSIITPDDLLLEQIDRRAPNATERLKCMKRLSDIGVKTSLRFRPILPGISDTTPRYKKAWRTLIRKARDAGAGAISYEVGFMPGMATSDLRRKWNMIEKIIDRPLREIYKRFGATQACTRPSYKWTENIMHAIYEEAHKCEMTVGVSDPVWKQLTDTGCCCGMLPDDPVFGNWQVESATNQFLIAMKTGKLLRSKDIVPEWAYNVMLPGMVNTGAGAEKVWRRRHTTWADLLIEHWNDLKAERSPLKYFQGALLPVKREGNEVVYKYRGLKRQNLSSIPYWEI